MKTIYISGPMTGLPDLNFPAFHAAASLLRAQGHEVRNPAEVGEEPGKTWEDYMRKDLRLLCDCDAIYMLPGYKNSRGACLELTVAERLGFEVMYQAEKEADGGIYSIVGPRGRLYIGQTHSFSRRWMEHRSALRGDRHHCAALQHSWNKHGEEAFQFEPMFVVPESCRDTVEQKWFDMLGRSLYNSALDVLSPARGRKASAETRAKMSASHKGQPHGPMSDETKSKISAARIGKYKGPESPFFGKNKSLEHCAKLSEAGKGKGIGSLNPVACPVICVETGECFPTYTAAAKWLQSNGHPKADLSTVRKAASGLLKTAYGFRWAKPELHIAHRLGMEVMFA